MRKSVGRSTENYSTLVLAHVLCPVYSGCNSFAYMKLDMQRLALQSTTTQLTVVKYLRIWLNNQLVVQLTLDHLLDVPQQAVAPEQLSATAPTD